MYNKKYIFIRVALLWAVLFGTLFAMSRYFLQEIKSPPFDSWILYIVVCILGGASVSFFSIDRSGDN